MGRLDVAHRGEMQNLGLMKKILSALSLGLFIFVMNHAGYAAEKDLPLVVTSEYFSVYGYAGFNISRFLEKIDFDYFLQPDALLIKGKSSPEDLLAKTLDALYLQTSDILGINIYSYHGKIKIFLDRNAVNEVFQSYVGENFDESSFYLHKTNTIYMSSADMTLGMLGHEISHALMAHYFVVPPPVKVQEVLCGYVEYHLRKMTGSLPEK